MRLPWISKRGFAVRLPTGEYRGVFGSLADARLIWAMVGVMEPACLFEPPTIVPCRLRLWTRYGVRARPMGEERG